MNKTSVMHRILVLVRCLLTTTLLALHLGCSSGSESFLEYDANSTLNPSGPVAPDDSNPGDPSDPDNLIFNGGAEQGLEGWGYLGTPVSLSDAEAHTGFNSIFIEGRTENWHAPKMDLPDTLIAGTTYEVSVWVKLAADTEATNVAMTIKRTDDSGDTFTRLGDTEATSDDWVQITGLYTHDADGAIGELYVFIEAEAAVADYYVDDLKMKVFNSFVLNGDVESGIAPWRYQGDGVHITQATEEAHGGVYSLFVGGRSADWHAAIMDLPVSLPMNTDYNISVWVHLAPDTDDSIIKLSVKRTVDGTDGVEEEYLNVSESTVVYGEWVHLTGTYPHSVEGELTELYVYVESDNPIASYYVDDLDVVPANGN